MGVRRKEEEVLNIVGVVDSSPERLDLINPDAFDEEFQDIFHAMFDAGLTEVADIAFLLGLTFDKARLRMYGDRSNGIEGLWDVLRRESGVNIRSMAQLFHYLLLQENTVVRRVENPNFRKRD